MDYRWKATNTGRRSPGTRVPMVAQILQRNVHVVMSMLPSAAARRFWRRTAILLRSVRLAVRASFSSVRPDTGACPCMGAVSRLPPFRGGEAEQKALDLLKQWLSSVQLAQYESTGHFDVTGCHSGKHYRIRHGR